MELPIKETIRKIILLLLVLTGLGLFFVFQAYIYSTNTKQPFDWIQNLSYRMPVYILWGVLIPVINKLIKLFNPAKKRVLKLVTFHLLTGVTSAIVHRFISIIIAFIILDFAGKMQGNFSDAFARARIAIVGGSFDSLFMYGIIVTVLYSLDYYKKFRDNQLKTIMLEGKLATAQLHALKMQLQPHFLFNTLHTISALIHKNTEDADKVLTRLSDLLRISLERLDEQEVSLRRELSFIEKYVEIQKIRFQHRLNFEAKISSETYDLKVPNLILQPLIENAIKYGIEPYTKEGNITLTAEKISNRLKISIEDNGPGIGNDVSEGIGLSNTKARLLQAYGDSCKFSMSNISPHGLRITIEIPAINYEQNQNTHS